MQKLAHILTFLIIATIIFACDKERDNKGSVLVTVKYSDEAIAQAGVYLKRGNDTTSIALPTNFDKQTGSDAIGQVFFENLQPDTYTISAKGYSQRAGRLVSGKT